MNFCVDIGEGGFVYTPGWHLAVGRYRNEFPSNASSQNCRSGSRKTSCGTNESISPGFRIVDIPIRFFAARKVIGIIVRYIWILRNYRYVPYRTHVGSASLFGGDVDRRDVTHVFTVNHSHSGHSLCTIVSPHSNLYGNGTGTGTSSWSNVHEWRITCKNAMEATLEESSVDRLAHRVRIGTSFGVTIHPFIVVQTTGGYDSER